MKAVSRSILVLLLGFALPGGAVKITEYQVPTANSHPLGIAVAHNGIPFFTEFSGNKIGHVVNGTIYEMAVPTANAGPYGIAAVDARSVAFTEFLTGKVGILNEGGTGSIQEYTGGSAPRGIAADSALANVGLSEFWVADEGNDTVELWQAGFGTAQTTAYGLTVDSGALGVVRGLDGFAYVTESATGAIGLAGTFALYGHYVFEHATGSASSQPTAISAAPDGNVWFTEAGSNKIGRMLTTTAAIDEFPVPTPNAGLDGIAAGPDGNIWFLERNANKVGRMDLDGNVIREYVVPTPGSQPTWLCADASGNLWFTEYAGNKIGKIQVFVSGDVDDDGSVDVSDVFYLINFLFANGPAPR